MNYQNVISLQTAKDYLGIDDTARDNEITRMINSACVYIEKYTNVILTERENDYHRGDGCLKVYDFPINTNDPLGVKKGKYSEYPGDTVTLNVGFASPSKIPSDLIDAGLQIISVWFYGSEKQNNTSLMPESVKMVLDLHKRFLI